MTAHRTLFELAIDRSCPARRFALHCLYIYAADGIRTQFRAHPKRRLRKLVRAGRGAGRRADDRSGRTTAACCWPGRTSSTTTTGARAAWCASAAGSASDTARAGTPRGCRLAGMTLAAVQQPALTIRSFLIGRATRAPHDQRGRRATGRHEVSAGGTAGGLELGDPAVGRLQRFLQLGHPLAGARRPPARGSMIRLMPARLTPSSWLSRCTSRSSATSRALYRRPPPAARPGCTSPSRSYWRSVCGCMPASRAATEMISTLASERLLDRDGDLFVHGGHLRSPRRARARRRAGAAANSSSASRASAVSRVGTIDLDGDQQVAVLPVALVARPGHGPAASGRSGCPAAPAASPSRPSWAPAGRRRAPPPRSVIGTVRVRSSPDAAEQVVAAHLDQHVQVARRRRRARPARPGRPAGSAARRRRPAGMRTLSVRVLVTPPVPRHSGHFSSTIVPDALALAARLGEAERALVAGDQAGAVAIGQVRGWVPGLAPVPWQVSQTPGARSVSGRVAPRTASLEVERHLGLDVAAPGRAARVAPAARRRRRSSRTGR